MDSDARYNGRGEKPHLQQLGGVRLPVIHGLLAANAAVAR